MRHSYSSRQLFKRCKAAWKYCYIDRLPDTQAKPAAERGSRLHKAAERFQLGDIPQEKLPIQFRPFLKAMEQQRVNGASPEAVWLVNREWEEVGDEADAWLKAIIDVHWIEGETLCIRDYKSGRIYPDHKDQLELYMVIGAAMFPHVRSVRADAMYLDQGQIANEVEHNRLWLTELRKLWEERFDVIENELTYTATPSVFACRFCAYGKSKGGPCQQEHTGETETLAVNVREGN